jgi:hypothetical protein
MYADNKKNMLPQETIPKHQGNKWDPDPCPLNGSQCSSGAISKEKIITQLDTNKVQTPIPWEW